MKDSVMGSKRLTPTSGKNGLKMFVIVVIVEHPSFDSQIVSNLCLGNIMTNDPTDEFH